MGDLKYKVGDKVKIKSISDIGKIISNNGYVGNLPFGHTMNCTCGMVLTIDQIDIFKEVYRMKEFPWRFYNDEMIEGKIEDDCKDVFSPYKFESSNPVKSEKASKIFVNSKFITEGQYMDFEAMYNESERV